MKFLPIAFALIGLAAAAQLPDSATQGPNPQDIATPEPEYIDIDEPPPPAPAPAPAAPQVRSFAPVPIQRPIIHPAPAPIQRPIIHSAPAPIHFAPQQTYHAPAVQQVQLPGHTFSSQSGYRYRRPVYFRRVYRRLRH